MRAERRSARIDVHALLLLLLILIGFVDLDGKLTCAAISLAFLTRF